MCILLLDELFHKCQLYAVDWWCCSGQIYPYNFLPDRSVNSWQMLKSLTKRVILSFSHCISISFCLMNFNTPLLNVYRSEWLPPLGKLTSLSLHNTFFISDNVPCSEGYIWYKHGYASLILIGVCTVYLLSFYTYKLYMPFFEIGYL
jgi:hypothetical protein